MTNLLETLASDVFQMPALPGPIQDRAQNLDALANMLDAQRQALQDAQSTAVAAGHTGPSMTAAYLQTREQVQALANAAYNTRNTAAAATYIAAGFGILGPLIIALKIHTAFEVAMEPAAAHLALATAGTTIKRAREELLHGLVSMSRRNDVGRIERTLYKIVPVRALEDELITTRAELRLLNKAFYDAEASIRWHDEQIQLLRKIIEGLDTQVKAESNPISKYKLSRELSGYKQSLKLYQKQRAATDRQIKNMYAYKEQLQLTVPALEAAIKDRKR